MLEVLQLDQQLIKYIFTMRIAMVTESSTFNNKMKQIQCEISVHQRKFSFSIPLLLGVNGPKVDNHLCSEFKIRLS